MLVHRLDFTSKAVFSDFIKLSPSLCEEFRESMLHLFREHGFPVKDLHCYLYYSVVEREDLDGNG